VLLFRNTVSIVWTRPFCDPVGAGVSAGPFNDRHGGRSYTSKSHRNYWWRQMNPRPYLRNGPLNLRFTPRPRVGAGERESCTVVRGAFLSIRVVCVHRFHVEALLGDFFFLCLEGGLLHLCWTHQPCSGCILSQPSNTS